MKKMKRLGCFTALFFTVLFIHPVQAQMSYAQYVDKHILTADIQLSPIPAKDVLNLQFQTQQTVPVHIRISSLTGRVIHKAKLAANSGLHTQTFDIADFPRGTYFLSVSAGQYTQTKRFVKH